MAKIRNIAGWITLVTYITGVLTLALFHFHAPVSAFNNTPEITLNQDTTNQFSATYHSADDCTFCKVNSQHFLYKTISFYFQPMPDVAFIISSKLVYKRLVIDSLLRRGPPTAV